MLPPRTHRPDTRAFDNLRLLSGYLDMERRWLALARSYEFAERASRFTAPLRTHKRQKE
jgi:hypothetical protein